jgi:hypothetical protein
MVGDVGLALERNARDFNGLVVIERLEYGLVKLIDVDRLIAIDGGFGGMVGQGFSLV